jgi:hypothetical protein
MIAQDTLKALGLTVPSLEDLYRVNISGARYISHFPVQGMVDLPGTVPIKDGKVDLPGPHLDGIKSRRLRHVSSLALRGPDLRTAYLGCLLGDAIAAFRSPFAGAPPVHSSFERGECSTGLK